MAASLRLKGAFGLRALHYCCSLPAFDGKRIHSAREELAKPRIRDEWIGIAESMNTKTKPSEARLVVVQKRRSKYPQHCPSDLRPLWWGGRDCCSAAFSQRKPSPRPWSGSQWLWVFPQVLPQVVPALGCASALDVQIVCFASHVGRDGMVIWLPIPHGNGMDMWVTRPVWTFFHLSYQYAALPANSLPVADHPSVVMH